MKVIEILWTSVDRGIRKTIQFLLNTLHVTTTQETDLPREFPSTTITMYFQNTLLQTQTSRQQQAQAPVSNK